MSAVSDSYLYPETYRTKHLFNEGGRITLPHSGAHACMQHSAAQRRASNEWPRCAEHQAVAHSAQQGASSLEPVLGPAPEGEASEICEKFPDWVWISGILVSILAATGVFGHFFPMPHWQVAVAMVLAMLVAVLAVRALGETDLNPVSGIGKLTQVCFALLAPGKVLPNLVAGAISEAAAMQAGDMMQDFKTAYLLGMRHLAAALSGVGMRDAVACSACAWAVSLVLWGHEHIIASSHRQDFGRHLFHSFEKR